MSEQKKIWFKFFACCFIVDGFTNSLIYDIQRNGFYDLPDDFAKILKLSQHHSLADLIEISNVDAIEMESFLSQFIKEEIAFYTSEPESFPDIDLSWNSPYLLTNSIIEIQDYDAFDIPDVIDQLHKIGCQALQIRFLKTFSWSLLVKQMELFKESRFKYIEIIMPHREDIELKDLYELMLDEPRLNRIILYGYSEDVILLEEKKLGKAIMGIKKDILIDSKEVIKRERFKTSIESFTEAQDHNIGLNRKLCITSNGEIKNFLNHKITFGNVKNTKIMDVVKDSMFQEKWYISNTQIEVCKDCQYKYCCVSNSDVIRENDRYFKTDKCPFDPYTNTWKISIQ